MSGVFSLWACLERGSDCGLDSGMVGEAVRNFCVLVE